MTARLLRHLVQRLRLQNVSNFHGLAKWRLLLDCAERVSDDLDLSNHRNIHTPHLNDACNDSHLRTNWSFSSRGAHPNVISPPPRHIDPNCTTYAASITCLPLNALRRNHLDLPPTLSSLLSNAWIHRSCVLFPFELYLPRLVT